MNSKLISVSCLLIFFNKMCKSNAFSVGNNSFTNYNCKTPNVKPWIYFQYDVCLHLIVNANQYPSICIRQLIDGLTDDGVVIYQKTLTHMKSRSIFNLRKTKCESYLFVMENPQDWLDGINQQMNKTQKIFFPFSRLYFLSLNGKDLGTFGNLTKFLHRNAFFGYDFHFDAIGHVISIRDVLNNFTMKSSPNFTDLAHPLLDTTNHNREFTVSVFNCPPHIVYLDTNGSR